MFEIRTNDLDPHIQTPNSFLLHRFSLFALAAATQRAAGPEHVRARHGSTGLRRGRAHRLSAARRPTMPRRPSPARRPMRIAALPSPAHRVAARVCCCVVGALSPFPARRLALRHRLLCVPPQPCDACAVSELAGENGDSILRLRMLNIRFV